MHVLPKRHGSARSTLPTHPMTIRRIEELRRYAASSEYRPLQSLVYRNVLIAGRRRQSKT